MGGSRKGMNCPIFTKQFPRETFEQMLRENPLNDHLIVQEKIPDQIEGQIRQEPMIA